MQVRSRITLSLVALSLLPSLAWASGCKRESRHKTPLQRGHWLFSTRCAHCHGPYGKGDGRPVPGPRQPRNLANAKLYELLDEAAIKHVVRTGMGEMPAFGGWITDTELDDLIVFLHALPERAKTAPKYRF